MLQRFIKFRPDNFTHHARTPWAGQHIARSIKDGLGLNLPPYIGESWEFSTTSELPSICADSFDGTFADFLIAGEHSKTWLSEGHRSLWGCGSPLLVKYIDAGEDLSIQLHPPLDAYRPHADQCGKWESWLILKNAPRAGIYLGLEPCVTKDMFLDAVTGKREIRPLLHFVEVLPGELYAIPPCTIHALGSGLCVLEPQIIQPSKKAVSLRLHDWNRRYDAHGNRSETGKPRALHVEEALKYIDFDDARGHELENKCRIPPRILYETDKLRLVEFPQKPWLMATIVSGTGEILRQLPGEITFITVMQGKVQFALDGVHVELKCGESGAISASAKEMLMTCSNARVYMANCLPELYAECVKGRL